MCIPDENFEARLRDFFEVEGTLEIKSDEINEKAITECYHNMFAGATKIITNVLSQGKVVKRAVMYGIVCNMQQPQKSIMLRLEIDIDQQHCHFFRLLLQVPFSVALNRVLSRLCE